MRTLLEVLVAEMIVKEIKLDDGNRYLPLQTTVSRILEHLGQRQKIFEI